MKKSEIKKATNAEIVYEYAIMYSLLCDNYNTGRSTKTYEQRCRNLEDELLKRELLTEEQIEKLHK